MKNKLQDKQRKFSIANRLREVRQLKGLTQFDIATELQCTQGQVSQYESGAVAPSLEVLINLCTVLGCSLDYLVGNDVDNQVGPRAEMLGYFDELTPEQQDLFVVMLKAAADRVIFLRGF